MSRYLKAIFVLGLILPACDGVCVQASSASSHRDREQGCRGVQEQSLRLSRARAKAVHPDGPHLRDGLLQPGQGLSEAAQVGQSHRRVRGAAQRSPSNANYQYDLGEAYLEAKHLDKAETALKKATELDPKLFKAQWRLGLVFLFQERPKEADLALRNAIELNPRMDKPFIALGRLYLDFDADKEAAQVLAECVRANENSAECYNLHGVALKSLKQYEQAVSEFKKALDVDSGLFDALYNCGMTYAECMRNRTPASRSSRPVTTCRNSWLPVGARTARRLASCELRATSSML